MLRNKKYFILLLVGLVLFFTRPVYGSSNYLDVSIGSFSYNTNYRVSSEDKLFIMGEDGQEMDYLGHSELDLLISGGRLVVYSLDKEKLGDYKLEEVLLVSEAGSLKINKSEYRGQLRFIANSKGGTIINHIDIEDYLYGVVPREMGASFPDEALKAQAIASRSFAMTNRQKHKGQGFNLCNTVHCQVYSGKSVEDQRINDLVDQTRGQYVYSDGDIVETVFHSNNGGYMESSENAWGTGYSHLVNKKDEFSVDSPNSDWTYEISRKDFNNRLRANGISIGDIREINIVDQTDGKRVASVELVGSSKKELIGAGKLRSILGSNNFKSTWFKIAYKDDIISRDDLDLVALDHRTSLRLEDDLVYLEGSQDFIKKDIRDLNILGRKKEELGGNNKLDSDKIVFVGRGFGHGVGMSQYGAKTMAEQGYNYREILGHYYDGTEVF